ncbi:unnamed protein product [Musa acuminata subsp. malaccensis]|uniref:(wild Malaysian banana) hypothetical protein n=1 Tax=Musa acuminata subsp. malaccensis TaxID=214687 RepID=A0A804HWK3_MUSAM|nr:unnamed protein product [Musa acuminata subsp. malaccensis]
MQPSCINLVVDSSAESSSQSSFWDLFELDLYINHIMNEAGATVVLRGRESEHHDLPLQPLHLSLLSTNPKSLEVAKILPENLLDSFLWI